MLGVGRLLAALVAVAIVALGPAVARAAEAEVGATGTPFRRHQPATAPCAASPTPTSTSPPTMRAGGRVIYGEPFDRVRDHRGARPRRRRPRRRRQRRRHRQPAAHGPPFGTHDTHGWPTFAGWPTYDTNTHQQTYYRWLQRAWMSGLRLVVAQTVEDEPICRIEPVRSHSCDETADDQLEIRQLRGPAGLRRRARAAGPASGWFRLVDRPAPGAAGDRAGQARGRHRGRVVGPVRLQRVHRQAALHAADVDRGSATSSGGSASAACSSPTGSTTRSPARRSRAAPRASSSTSSTASRPAHYFTTGPCPDPGQGEEVDDARPGRDCRSWPVLPGAARPIAAEACRTTRRASSATPRA